MNSNKYNSLVDSFYATDLYNLVMPAVPPASLNIPAATFAISYFANRVGAVSKVVGFDKRDKPYFRGLGLYSNLGAGLRDAAAAHYGSSNGWQLTLQLQRFAAELTGTIANVAGTNAVAGVGTSFTTELGEHSIISWVDDNGVVRVGVVATVTDDTNLVLSSVTDNTGMATANTAASTAFPFIADAGNSIDFQFITMNEIMEQAFFIGDVSGIYPPRGTVACGTATVVLEGVGTFFTEDYSNGMPIVFGTGANRRTYVIDTITDDTHLNLYEVPSVAVRGAPLVEYDHHLRIRARVPVDFLAYTVDLNPLYGAGNRRLSISGAAVIEHSFPLITAIS